MAVEAPILKELATEDAVMQPILVHYKNCRTNMQLAGAVAVAIQLIIEIATERKVTVAGCSYLFCIPCLCGLAGFIQMQPEKVSKQFMELYDTLLLLSVCAFEAVACIAFRREALLMHALTVAFCTAAYTLPQLSQTRSINIFVVCHICTCAYMLNFNHELCVPVVITLLLVFVNAHQSISVVLAAESIESELQMKVQALKKHTESWWLLLEHAFDGIVQIERGTVKWANAKFFETLPHVKIGSCLRSTFVVEDQLSVDDLLAHTSVHRRCLVTGQCTQNHEFDCELVDASIGAQEDGVTILGLRIMGEPRQMQETGRRTPLKQRPFMSSIGERCESESGDSTTESCMANANGHRIRLRRDDDMDR